MNAPVSWRDAGALRDEVRKFTRAIASDRASIPYFALVGTIDSFAVWVFASS